MDEVIKGGSAYLDGNANSVKTPLGGNPGSVFLATFLLGNTDGVKILQDGDRDGVKIRKDGNTGGFKIRQDGNTESVRTVQAGDTGSVKILQNGNTGGVKAPRGRNTGGVKTLQAGNTDSITTLQEGNPGGVKTLQTGNKGGVKTLQNGNNGGVKILQGGNKGGIKTLQAGDTDSVKMLQGGNTRGVRMLQGGNTRGIKTLQDGNKGSVKIPREWNAGYVSLRRDGGVKICPDRSTGGDKIRQDGTRGGVKIFQEERTVKMHQIGNTDGVVKKSLKWNTNGVRTSLDLNTSDLKISQDENKDDVNLKLIYDYRKFLDWKRDGNIACVDENADGPSWTTDDTRTSIDGNTDGVQSLLDWNIDPVKSRMDWNADDVQTLMDCSVDEILSDGNTESVKSCTDLDTGCARPFPHADVMNNNTNAIGLFVDGTIADVIKSEKGNTRTNGIVCGKSCAMSIVGLLALMNVYCFGGALLFFSLEGSNDTRPSLQSLQQRALKGLLNLSLEQNAANDKGKRTQEIDRHLSEFREGITCQVADPVFDVNGHSKWTYGASLLFCASLITTIGYGNMIPLTTWGRIAAIVYTLVGVPLTMLFLTVIGFHMAQCTNLLYGKIVTKCGWKKYVDRPRVPAWVCLTLIVGYVCLCSMLFSCLESWSYFESFYFCFLTLSTIGFGDLAPGLSGSQNNTTKTQAICLVYIFAGLALIAMCFHLMKEGGKGVIRRFIITKHRFGEDEGDDNFMTNVHRELEHIGLPGYLPRNAPRLRKESKEVTSVRMSQGDFFRRTSQLSTSRNSRQSPERGDVLWRTETSSESGVTGSHGSPRQAANRKSFWDTEEESSEATDKDSFWGTDEGTYRDTESASSTGTNHSGHNRDLTTEGTDTKDPLVDADNKQTKDGADKNHSFFKGTDIDNERFQENTVKNEMVTKTHSLDCTDNRRPQEETNKGCSPEDETKHLQEIVHAKLFLELKEKFSSVLTKNNHQKGTQKSPLPRLMEKKHAEGTYENHSHDDKKKKRVRECSKKEQINNGTGNQAAGMPFALVKRNLDARRQSFFFGPGDPVPGKGQSCMGIGDNMKRQHFIMTTENRDTNAVYSTSGFMDKSMKRNSVPDKVDEKLRNHSITGTIDQKTERQCAEGAEDQETSRKHPTVGTEVRKTGRDSVFDKTGHDKTQSRTDKCEQDTRSRPVMVTEAYRTERNSSADTAARKTARHPIMGTGELAARRNFTVGTVDQKTEQQTTGVLGGKLLADSTIKGVKKRSACTDATRRNSAGQHPAVVGLGRNTTPEETEKRSAQTVQEVSSVLANSESITTPTDLSIHVNPKDTDKHTSPTHRHNRMPSPRKQGKRSSLGKTDTSEKPPTQSAKPSGLGPTETTLVEGPTKKDMFNQLSVNVSAKTDIPGTDKKSLIQDTANQESHGTNRNCVSDLVNQFSQANSSTEVWKGQRTATSEAGLKGRSSISTSDDTATPVKAARAHAAKKPRLFISPS